MDTLQVQQSNAFYKWQNGCLVEVPNKTLVLSNGKAPIPEEVEHIGPYAYYYNTNVSLTVIFPQGLKSVGTSAFEGCTAISHLIFPDGFSFLGNRSFYHLPSLQTVKFGSGIRYIEEEAFGNGGLQEVYITDLAGWCESVHPKTGIDTSYKLYLDENPLTDFVMPEGVFFLGKGVFANCQSLINVTLDKPLISIGDNAFLGCQNLKTLKIDCGDVRIGDSVFSSCNHLMSVIMEEGLTRIGKYMFADNSNLYQVIMPNSLRVVDDYAFLDNDDLSLVEFSDSLARIGAGAFANCRNLKEVFIPASVETVAEKGLALLDSKCIIRLEAQTVPEGFLPGWNGDAGCTVLTGQSAS
jgi:hypothetical protein